MADEKPLTKKDLLEVLHDFWKDVALPEFQKVRNELRKEIGSVRDELKAEIRENRRQINNLKADTPTRKEFDELKVKVDRHHPTN